MLRFEWINSKFPTSLHITRHLLTEIMESTKSTFNHCSIQVERITNVCVKERNGSRQVLILWQTNALSGILKLHLFLNKTTWKEFRFMLPLKLNGSVFIFRSFIDVIYFVIKLIIHWKCMQTLSMELTNFLVTLFFFFFYMYMVYPSIFFFLVCR